MNLTLEGDRILKDGEEIGRYDAGSNTLHVPKRIAPTVQKQITELLGQKPAYDVAPENPPKGGEPPKPVKAKAPLLRTGTLKEQYPDYPGEIDPFAGDKTPEFVAWLDENYPEEAKARYRGRVVGGVLR